MPTGPQRLVLICSGPYEYAEVELADGTLQIVGPNNLGKTTLIKTLQFLYIDDRRQMDFGSYSSEQTREFYFPNQYSYILFECLGATGQCVIGWRGQSKNSGADPERFFHSGPFSVTDFLDEKNRVREPRDVSARLGASKHYRIIKSGQEQKELLLPAVGGNGRGLGIVALRNADKYHHFRETLKDLLSLSAITQEQMRDRLLMLADIRTDRVAIDAREFQDYDLLEKRKKQLKKFKDNQAFVKRLIGKFDEREVARAELAERWTDLRSKRQRFEKENDEKLTKLRDEVFSQKQKLDELEEEKDKLLKDVREFSVEKGKLEKPLDDLAASDTEFAGFAEGLERLALENLNNELESLKTQLANAEGESREKAKQKVEIVSARVSEKKRMIENYGHLAITELRKHFSDGELNAIFRVLNRDLLALPMGNEGVSILRQEDLIAALRGLLERTRGGVYRDMDVSFRLPKSADPLAGLENPDAVREQLAEDQATLERWKQTLASIEQRENLEAKANSKREIIYGRNGNDGEIVVEGKQRQLFRFEEYQKAKADEVRLRAELMRSEENITAANERLGKLALQYKVVDRAKTDAEGYIRTQEENFKRVVQNFNKCLFPDFSAKAHVDEGIPDDFEAAIEIFLRQQERQNKLCEEIANLLVQTEYWFADEFRGEEEGETIRNLREEFEALAEKEDALSRDWNAHLHGLKATFDLVLRSLGHVASAAADINRSFTKVQVSNLKAIKLEVVEQSDLVSWIKRMAAFEPGGLFDADPQQESTIANFRRRLENNPVIRFAELFTLGVTVTRANDQRHTYHDLRQIESDGTTITVKVLFNLLLLKSQLKGDDCSVPFFLDEIQDLDPDNRRAILRTARQLGFIAITAAPQAVSEVDALYFLQPQKGRLVLRRKHLATLKRTDAAIEP